MKFFHSKKIIDFCLIGWIIILSAAYCFLSIQRHNTFQSGAFDLGIYDQTVWKYANFITPHSTIKERFILGDHLTLTLPLLAPLLYFWPNVRILLIFQAVFITLSTVPIYFLIKNRNFAPQIALILSVIYSLFYGIQFAVYFDFHPIVLGVALLSWLAYFFEAKKKFWFWLTLILMLATQENMGIALACLGLIYFFQKKYRKAAILMIIFGLLVSFVEVKIVSLFSPVGYEYSPRFDLNPFNDVVKLFDTNDKRLVWLYSFSWYSFLPLFSPGGILAMLLDLSQYFLPMKQYGHMVTPFLHHRAILSPLLLLASLDTLNLLKTKKINLTIVAIVMLVVSLSLQFVFHFPLNKLSKSAYWQITPWMKNNEELIKLVPKTASVATQQNLVPHISERSEIYLVWPRIRGNQWWLEFTGSPDYLLVDVHSDSWVTQLLETPEHVNEALTNMERAGKIRLIKQIGYSALYSIEKK